MTTIRAAEKKAATKYERIAERRKSAKSMPNVPTKPAPVKQEPAKAPAKKRAPRGSVRGAIKKPNAFSL